MEPSDDTSGRPRRRLLTGGLAAAGAAVFAAGGDDDAADDSPAVAPAAQSRATAPAATAATPASTPTAQAPSVRNDFMISRAGKAPATPPFLVPLPIPQVKRAESGLSPLPGKYPVEDEAGRLPHQAWERYPPRTFYRLRVREGKHSFHPHLPEQTILSPVGRRSDSSCCGSGWGAIAGPEARRPIGIGVASMLANPSHTTRHAGPHRAVRVVEVK